MKTAAHTGLPGEAKSLKRFERSNGLDTALYKNYLYLFTTHRCDFCDEDCHSRIVLSINKKRCFSRASCQKQKDGGAVAEWFRAFAWTVHRVVLAVFESRCGNSIRFGTLAIPITLLCQCLSEKILKSRRSLLSGVYARGSKISHHSALEMCNPL